MTFLILTILTLIALGVAAILSLQLWLEHYTRSPAYKAWERRMDEQDALHD